MNASKEKGSSKSRNQKLVENVPIIVKALYKDIDSFGVSLNHRKTLNSNHVDTKHLTYGEISCVSFLQILQWIEDREDWFRRNKAELVYENSDKIFFDLGSGSGKACITSALSITRIFSQVKGIEIVPELYSQANFVKDKLLEEICRKDQSNLSSKSRNIKNDNIENSLYKNKILNVLIDVLSSAESQSLPLCTLANEVCKVINHKIFKLVTKKGFLKFINEHSELFSVSDSIITLINNRKFEECSTESNVNKKSTSAEFSIEFDVKELLMPLPIISYELGSIFDSDWYRNCYVAFAASLLFSEEMMNKLVFQVSQMQHGSWFITLKELPLQINIDNLNNNNAVVLESESFYKMSWEMCKVYIYKIVHKIKLS